MGLINQTLPINVKYLFIVSVVLYVLLLLGSLAKRLFVGKPVRVTPPLFGNIVFGLLVAGFLGIGAGLVLSTVGIARFQSSLLTMERDGERMRADYPQGQFYYGLLDLAEDVQRLTVALQQKCQNQATLESLAFSELFTPASPGRAVADSPFDSETFRTLETQFERLRANTFRAVGSCSSSEQDYLKQIIAARDYVLFSQNRFQGIVFSVTNKMSMALIGMVVMIPVTCLLLLFCLYKLRQDYGQLQEPEAKPSSAVFWRSHFGLLLALLFIFNFGGSLLASVASQNAAQNVRDVYNKHFVEVDGAARVASAAGSDALATEMRPLLAAYHAGLREFVGQQSAVRLSAFKPGADASAFQAKPSFEAAAQPDSQLAHAFGLVSGQFELQDAIDDLLKLISANIKASTFKPLMLTHLDTWQDIFGPSLYNPAALGVGCAILAFLTHLVQIVVFM